MKTFPTLYKKTTTGAIQQWTISADGASFTKTYGQVGGAMQSTTDSCIKGKNAGRANATTPSEQALAEAQSQWEGKKKKGYVEDLDAAEDGKVDDLIEGGIFPMLAQGWKDHSAKIKYPCFVQRKYDGIRCIAMIRGGKATLWTRTRKQIKSMPHIVAALEKNFSTYNITFDGELYLHSLHEDFEQLTHLARPGGSPIEGGEKIEYHIYDLVSPAPYRERLLYLLNIWAKMPSDHKNPLIMVASYNAGDPMIVARYCDQFIEEGYEGAIVRNASTPYEVGKRSYGLQKVKIMVDAEFPIIGVKPGRGRMADMAIFMCALPNGGQVDVKLKGSMEALKKYLNNPSSWTGKKLTVQFQGYNKSGSLRFPVGKAVRDYE